MSGSTIFNRPVTNGESGLEVRLKVWDTLLERGFNLSDFTSATLKVIDPDGDDVDISITGPYTNTYIDLTIGAGDVPSFSAGRWCFQLKLENINGTVIYTHPAYLEVE